MTNNPESYNHYRRRSVEAENNELKAEINESVYIVRGLLIVCILLAIVIFTLLIATK